MADPQEKTENAWLKRLKGFFRRDKTSAPKQKKELTSADRDKRAFRITIVTGLLMVLVSISYAFELKNVPLDTFFDKRIYVILVGASALIGAWLSRRGRSSSGISLFLIAFFIVGILAGSTTSGTGASIAAVGMGITLAITSATMPPLTARRINTFGLLVFAIPILLDVFEPFPRPADPTPVSSWSLTVILLIVYAVIVGFRFNTYNLRTKLIIAFAGVTLLPLFGLGLYNNLKLSDALYNNEQDTLVQFTDQTALHVDTFIQNQITSINTQSQTPSFIQYLSLSPSTRANTNEEENAKNTLAAFSDQGKKFIVSYLLLDTKSNIVIDTDKLQEKDENQTNIFNYLVKQKQAAITGPFFNQKNGKASLYFSAPVKNETGTLLGVLVAEYQADIIESVVEELIPASNIHQVLFRVVDSNTFVRIANTNDHKLLYKSYQNFTPEKMASLQKAGLLLPGSTQDALAVENEIVKGLQTLNQSSFFTTSADKNLQTKNLNNGVLLKNAPWWVLVQQSETAVLTSLIQQRRTTTIIFLVLLAIVTAAAFGFSQLLASPILSLATTAQKIAAGDLTLQSDIESNDEIGTLATSFNQMTRQTRTLINSLEQRSKALATSSEVSRRISTILDQQELVTEVVKQVQLAFGYYHAHIYLLDENTQELIMAGGTGEAGKAMLARNHKIPLGKGLVGRAAQNNITVLVTNVAEEPQWLPNPLLPDTKSEVAVPIAIAERILGVLDVQHNVADTLKQEDVDVLQSIANQVAFAVRNARSYSEVQAKADRESLISSIGQKIQGTITVESAMQVAIREIGRALNGAKTQITLNENSTADHVHNDEGTTLESEN